MRDLDEMKTGLAEIVGDAMRHHCEQGGETMLLCESIIRLDEDIYEDNMGYVATVVEILHPGVYEADNRGLQED